METVMLSISKNELQNLVAEAVTASLRVFQPIQQPVLPVGNATRQQAADFFNISLVTLNEMTKSGKIKGQRLGGRVLYKWSDLEAALTAINTSVK